MMQQLALRMKAFHALGYVHRDLKPGNVMWLPRENRWTVIDFGCAVKTGEPARLGFSLAYAAPEVVAAYRRGVKTMPAQVCLHVAPVSMQYQSSPFFHVVTVVHNVAAGGWEHAMGRGTQPCVCVFAAYRLVFICS